MSGGPEPGEFLGRWLTIRTRDEAVAGSAATLHGLLASLVSGEVPVKLRECLFARVEGLGALVEAIDGEGGPTVAPNSPRGKWSRDARALVGRWNADRWAMLAIDWAGAKDPLAIVLVSQSLEEAIGRGPGAEPARKLRAVDERPFQSVPLPPGPRAPWHPSDYLMPADARAVVDRVDRALAESSRGLPGDSPMLVPSKDLAESIKLIGAGWPIPRLRLSAQLGRLVALAPDGSELAGSLREAIAGVGPSAESTPAQAPEAPGPEPGDPEAILRRRASEGLADLARSLRSGPPEARAFGRRLEGIDIAPSASTLRGLHLELVGCLAALDEAGDPGASWRWRGSAMDRLAGIAQALDGGEVLGDDRLLGQPLGRWADGVTVAGIDDRAPPGEPRRITRVDRIGYRMAFADGDRKVIVRARVWVAP